MAKWVNWVPARLVSWAVEKKGAEWTCLPLVAWEGGGGREGGGREKVRREEVRREEVRREGVRREGVRSKE